MKKMIQLKFKHYLPKGFFLFISSLLVFSGWAQPGSMSINQDVSGTYTNTSMTAVGVGTNNAVYRARFQEGTGQSSGTRNWQFNTDSYFNTWGAMSTAGSNLTLSSFNSVISPSTSTASANWQGGPGYNSKGRLPATTSSYYYTYNIRKGTSYASQDMAILETSYLPRDINSVSVPSNIYGGQTASVSVTMSGALNASEYLYIAWSTDAFATSGNSGCVSVGALNGSFVGTATIPAQTSGTITYYAFSSTSSTSPSFVNIPLLILNMRNGSAQNSSAAYSSYTIQSWTTQSGATNFSSGSSWVGGVAPAAGSNMGAVAINHSIQLDQNNTTTTIAVANSTSLTVNSGLTLQIGGGISTPSSGTLTVNGTLQINTGGFTSIAPTYGSSSLLVYYSGTAYGRGTEWSTTSGAGYPKNIQISNATTLNVRNGSDVQRQISGDLTVDNGCTFNMESLTIGSPTVIGVIVSGNIINNGTVNMSTTSERLKCTNFINNSTGTATMSSTSGGDIEVTGNLVDSGTFNANTRAVFFTGTGTQDVSGSGTFNIDYIVITKASGSVRMLNNLLCEGPNGGNAITLSSSTDILDLNGKTLTLGKAAVTSTISGSGFIKGSSTSSLIIQGTSGFGTFNFDQTSDGSTNALLNFTMNRTSTGTATLGNKLNIVAGGVVTMTAGTLTTGGNLTLKSNVSGSASIGNSSGTISGNVTVEKYISGSGRRWRYLGAPVTGQTLASWGSQFYITGPGTAGATVGSANQNGYATTRSNLLGFNLTSIASVKRYDETATGSLENGWSNPASHMSTTLTPGVGYRTFVRGPITGTYATDTIVIGYFDVNGAAPTQSSFTLTQTGGITNGTNAGSVVMPISATATGSGSSFDASNDGWNLLANPYPCAFDWLAFWTSNANRTSIGTAIHVFDATANSYKSYSTQAGSGSLTGALIPSGTAFFVQATGTNAALTFTETFKTTTNPLALHKTSTNNELHIKYFRDSTESDEYILKMIDGATLNKDDYDITKMKNDNLNLSSYGSDSVFMTLSSIPVVTTETHVSMNVEATQKGTYFFNFTNLESFSPTMRIQLLDKFTQKTIDVRKASSYTFVMDSLPHQWGKDRFVLILNDTTFASPSGVKDIANEITASYALYPVPTNDVLNIAYKNNTAKNIHANVFDTKGNRVTGVVLNALGTDGKTSINVSNLAQGIYFIHLSDENGAAIKTMKFVK